MSVRRVMGIETEYGISVPGQPSVNPMVASTHIVAAYAREQMRGRQATAHWDYALEMPLRDARGFDMTRAEADPSQLTDEDFSTANTILTNGARLYVDHAHPEYSSPEVTTPMDAVLWDRAGMEIMSRAMSLAAQESDVGAIVLYKNNTDNKGASYGCHENYLMSRTTPFNDIVRHLLPFFATRQVYAGAGRLGLGQDARVQAFQLSQRADFFETEVGLETTLKRPIVNTRDEPHADPERHRRLHVIVGDANMSESATYVKMAATSIVLSLIEAGALEHTSMLPRRAVDEIHRVSHDISLSHLIELEDGRRLTAIDIQEAFLESARAFYAGGADDDTLVALAEWERVLGALRTDPHSLAGELDWVAKLELMEGYIRRDGLDWSSPRLQLVDLQYADIRPDKGLALRLEARGSLRRLTSAEEVARAVTSPPDTTRAYFRGECVRRYGAAVAAASWDSVVLDVPGMESLQRIPTLDPLRGTRSHVEGLLEAHTDVASLVRALTATSG